MNYNPYIHHRESIRLKDYDYSKEGMYFITICTQNRECLFGDIVDKPVGANLCVRPDLDIQPDVDMILNKAGLMIEKWIKELPNKYINIKCNEYIIMPNHFHCIIEIFYNNEGEHIGSPLHEIIKWFKTMTTNEYIRMVKNNELPNFEKRIWQRNYYENIIRNEEIHQKVVDYIKINPLKWQDDKYYVKKQLIMHN